MGMNGRSEWMKPWFDGREAGEFGVEFLAMRPAQLQRIQQFVIKARPLS
jgi:hypothetical protein